jgi:hypothetical protein
MVESPTNTVERPPSAHHARAAHVGASIFSRTLFDAGSDAGSDGDWPCPSIHACVKSALCVPPAQGAGLQLWLINGLDTRAPRETKAWRAVWTLRATTHHQMPAIVFAEKPARANGLLNAKAAARIRGGILL